MKKWIYVIIVAVIIIIAIFVGNMLFKSNDNTNTENQVQNNIKEQDEVEENIFTNDISVSSIEQEKISPNAVLILKKHYEECNHTIKEYAKMPEEYVNLNQEELAKKQENWQIEEFSKDEVTLIKDVTSVCNEHYVLREKDGIIAVYQIHEDNTETLKEETGIAVEYLTDIDKLRLEEGIRIYGEEELNSTLEDYE